jgi:hypothetical protein
LDCRADKKSTAGHEEVNGCVDEDLVLELGDVVIQREEDDTRNIDECLDVDGQTYPDPRDIGVGFDARKRESRWSSHYRGAERSKGLQRVEVGSSGFK